MEVRMFRRILLVVVATALLLSVGLAGVWLWGQLSSPAAAQTSEEAPGYSAVQTITVLGQGSVRIEPDIARVTVGVETSAETISEAVAENESEMASVMAALEAVGIAGKDIQTTNFSIQQDRYPEPAVLSGSESGQAPSVYRVSNMVNVTIRDLEKVGEVLDAVIEAGANSIWGVSFSLDDLGVAEADARVDAMDDAQARAEALAGLSGVSLGPVMSVSEIIGGGAVPMQAIMVERAAAGGSAISPGELEVGYQVQVTYFIEQ